MGAPPCDMLFPQWFSYTCSVRGFMFVVFCSYPLSPLLQCMPPALPPPQGATTSPSMHCIPKALVLSTTVQHVCAWCPKHICCCAAHLVYSCLAPLPHKPYATPCNLGHFSLASPGDSERDEALHHLQEQCPGAEDSGLTSLLGLRCPQVLCAKAAGEEAELSAGLWPSTSQGLDRGP